MEKVQISSIVLSSEKANCNKPDEMATSSQILSALNMTINEIFKVTSPDIMSGNYGEEVFWTCAEKEQRKGGFIAPRTFREIKKILIKEGALEGRELEEIVKIVDETLASCEQKKNFELLELVWSLLSEKEDKRVLQKTWRHLDEFILTRTQQEKLDSW